MSEVRRERGREGGRERWREGWRERARDGRWDRLTDRWKVRRKRGMYIHCICVYVVALRDGADTVNVQVGE